MSDERNPVTSSLRHPVTDSEAGRPENAVTSGRCIPDRARSSHVRDANGAGASRTARSLCWKGTCVNDLAAADRPQLRGGERCHGDSLAVQSYEFHFEPLSSTVYMNARTDVARL